MDDRQASRRPPVAKLNPGDEIDSKAIPIARHVAMRLREGSHRVLRALVARSLTGDRGLHLARPRENLTLGDRALPAAAAE